MANLITLGMVEAAKPRDEKFIRIACAPCRREGRLSLTRLLAQHGQGWPVIRVIETTTRDCPWRLKQGASIHERCLAKNAPDLPLWFPK
jgi:hypothetical protein